MLRSQTQRSLYLSYGFEKPELWSSHRAERFWQNRMKLETLDLWLSRHKEPYRFYLNRRKRRLPKVMMSMMSASIPTVIPPPHGVIKKGAALIRFTSVAPATRIV